MNQRTLIVVGLLILALVLIGVIPSVLSNQLSPDSGASRLLAIFTADSPALDPQNPTTIETTTGGNSAAPYTQTAYNPASLSDRIGQIIASLGNTVVSRSMGTSIPAGVMDEGGDPYTPNLGGGTTVRPTDISTPTGVAHPSEYPYTSSRSQVAQKSADTVDLATLTTTNSPVSTNSQYVPFTPGSVTATGVPGSYPPACSMTAPESITSGQSARIVWWATNATGATISSIGLVDPSSGSHLVYPTTTTTYSASFSGVGGTAQCSVTIRVIPWGAAVGTPSTTYSTSAHDNTCGINQDYDIALVLDDSGSITPSEIVELKNAFLAFVRALIPARPDLFSVTLFNTSAKVQQSFTADTSLINAAINSAVSGGATNWQDGLTKAASTFDPRPEVHNLIVFASDGNPNTTPSGTVGTARALSAAVQVADSLKAAGTRIITLGIGAGAGGVSELNPANMQAISSPNSYYPVESFGTLAASLSSVSSDLCNDTYTGWYGGANGNGGAGGNSGSTQCQNYLTCDASGTEVLNACDGSLVRDCASEGSICSSGVCIPPPIGFASFNAFSALGQAFTASGHLMIQPTLVASGSTVRVYWNAVHAARCTVIGSNGDGLTSSPTGAWEMLFSGQNGVTTSPITQATTYTLHCTALPGALPSSINETQIVKVAPSYQER